MLTLTQNQHAQIKLLFQTHDGMLPVALQQQCLLDLDATIDQLMLAILPIAKELAVMPISGFSVGAVALGETGNLYVGANQEFTQASLCQSIHAEQSAVAVAHSHGETGIDKIAITASPCGHCRQFLMEQQIGGQLEILVDGGTLTTLAKLLPHAFGPKDLHMQAGLLTPQQHALEFQSATDDKLMTLAKQSAERSYAPYTKAYSGVALQMNNGKIYAGSYLENAVFNPSLPAMQVALVNVLMSGCQYADIIKAAFVQVEGASISQLASARDLLTIVCPDVSLQDGVLLDKSL